MSFNHGSGCAILQKEGSHVSFYSGPANLKMPSTIHLIADKRNKEYIGSIRNPQNNWRESHTFTLPAFGDKNKQTLKVKGLGEVIFNRGKTKPVYENGEMVEPAKPCIFMQVVEARQASLPM